MVDLSKEPEQPDDEGGDEAVNAPPAEVTSPLASFVRGLTGGNQGLFGFDDQWADVSDTIEGWFQSLGMSDVPSLLPLLSVQHLSWPSNNHELLARR